MTSTPPKLLLDEHVWQGLAAAFAGSEYDILHLSDTGQRGLTDEEVLELASSQERAVLTYNTRHFAPLARQWFVEGRTHWGIILSVEVAKGVLVKGVTNLLTQASAAEIRNTVR